MSIGAILLFYLVVNNFEMIFFSHLFLFLLPAAAHLG
jgi:hypothetical protein